MSAVMESKDTKPIIKSVRRSRLLGRKYVRRSSPKLEEAKGTWKRRTPGRTATCVDCRNELSPSLKSFDTWSEKYLHVAEAHMFRKFSCPYSPCNQLFRALVKLNEHIDQDHPGSERITEPLGYHDELVQKIKMYFPVGEGEPPTKNTPVDSADEPNDDLNGDLL